MVLFELKANSRSWTKVARLTGWLGARSFPYAAADCQRTSLFATVRTTGILSMMQRLLTCHLKNEMINYYWVAFYENMCQ